MPCVTEFNPIMGTWCVVVVVVLGGPCSHKSSLTYGPMLCSGPRGGKDGAYLVSKGPNSPMLI